MAAPEFVPTDPVARVRAYRSPPRRPESWVADRPGEIGFQPRGEGLGDPGPDLGYALKLVRGFEDRLRLQDGEEHHDVVGGCVAIAMRRASLFGRAPTADDLELAFTIWGYFDESPDPVLVALRRLRFEGVGHAAHHYVELRELVDAVPESTLRASVDSAARSHDAGWRGLVGA